MLAQWRRLSDPKFLEANLKALCVTAESKQSECDFAHCILNGRIRLTHVALREDIFTNFTDGAVESTTANLADMDSLVSLSYDSPSLGGTAIHLLSLVTGSRLHNLVHLDWPIQCDLSPMPSPKTLEGMLPNLAFFSCTIIARLSPEHLSFLFQLLEMDRIRVLVINMLHNETAGYFRTQYPELVAHPKLVVLVIPYPWADDWLSHVNGGPNYWTRAEEIVMARRNRS